jgi:phosphotriesterase-related protein
MAGSIRPPKPGLPQEPRVLEPHVVTVTGPLPAAALGVVDAHDHLFVASPALPGGEIEDPDKVAAEMREAKASGIGAIVEMTPIGLGRRPDLMRRVSQETGLPVIAATGYHRDAHYPAGHWVHAAPIEILADRVIADLTLGMHPRDWEGDAGLPLDVARAGAIKAGASYQRISRGEHRRLEAAAAGSRAAGVAILVHAEIGTCSRRRAPRSTGSCSPTWIAIPTWSSTRRSPRGASRSSSTRSGGSSTGRTASSST